MVQLKRVYEKPSRKDGLRILVDRLWPRGLTKEHAAVNLWLKDVAPSTQLRKWFGHDPARWKEFQTRYRKELRQNKEAIELLKLVALKGHILPHAEWEEKVLYPVIVAGSSRFSTSR